METKNIMIVGVGGQGSLLASKEPWPPTPTIIILFVSISQPSCSKAPKGQIWVQTPQPTQRVGSMAALPPCMEMAGQP